MPEDFTPELYQGHWIEIGRYPNVYEIGCTGATAEYILNPERTQFRVLNTCFDHHQMVKQEAGTATITSDPRILSLKFDKFGPESPASSYIILWTDYQYSFVASDDPNFYYILSRTPTLNRNEYDFIYQQTCQFGFDPSRVQINTDIELDL